MACSFVGVLGALGPRGVVLVLADHAARVNGGEAFSAAWPPQNNRNASVWELIANRNNSVRRLFVAKKENFSDFDGHGVFLFADNL